MRMKYQSASDNEEQKYWFKRKSFGWGWQPASIEGWIVTTLFIGALLYIGLTKGQDPDVTPQEILMPVGTLVIVLILICYKTGERPRWQWSIKKSKQQSSKEDACQDE